MLCTVPDVLQLGGSSIGVRLDGAASSPDSFRGLVRRGPPLSQSSSTERRNTAQQGRARIERAEAKWSLVPLLTFQSLAALAVADDANRAIQPQICSPCESAQTQARLRREPPSASLLDPALTLVL